MENGKFNNSICKVQKTGQKQRVRETDRERERERVRVT